MDQFDNLIRGAKNALIIVSKPLDFDCIASGLIIKKYLEAQNLTVRVIYPEKISLTDKNFYSFLPYFDQIEEGDTKELLKEKNFDLLILVDGGNLTQFYENSVSLDKVPNLSIYDKRIQIDHHLTNEGLGTLNIHQTDVSSTTELVLNKIIPVEFINQDIATLGYGGIVGDTGNFKWNFYASTMKLISTLILKGANKDMILDRLYFSRSKLELNMLSFATENTQYDDNLHTAFLFLPYQFLKNNNIDDNKLSILSDVYSAEVSRAVQGYPRGFILYEKGPGVIKISARGSTLGNRINLPDVLLKLGGSSGGHFNSCGSTVTGNFEEVKNKLLLSLQKYLKI